jgi:tetratricopeptide (TPR) repeat protein
MVSTQPMKALIAAILFGVTIPAGLASPRNAFELPSECVSKLVEVEESLHAERLQDAAQLWEKNGPECKNLTSDKTTRHRAGLVLGRILIHRGKIRESLPYLMTALEDADLMNYAALNLSAAYYKLGESGRAVTYGRKATETKDTDLKGRASFNVGLGLLQTLSASATPSKATELAAQAARAFTDAEALLPSSGAPAYYLGVIEELIRGDLKAAKSNYNRGCSRGFNDACQSLKLISKK